MSNIKKKRNVGAQTQKKWRSGGPPLEGRGAEGWSPEEFGPEGSGTAAWGPEGRAPRWGGPKVWGPKVGGPKFRFFFPSPAPIFALFLSLWGSSRGNLVVFEAPGPLNVHVL